MQYENPKIPEGINVSTEHPLKEFAQLVIGVVGGVVVLVIALAVFAERLARYVPFETELEIAERYRPTLPERGPVADYLQTLADQLAAAAELPAGMRITVHYVDNDTVNALATLGGNVVVFRGLLAQMPNENALAMVLAHEIAHVQHRHPVMALGRGIAIGLGLSALANLSGSGLAGRVLQDAGLLTVLHFNRDQEAEADATALATLARHYGHATGADTFFQIMQRLPGREAKENLPSFLSTHPETGDRIERLRARAHANGWALDRAAIPLPEAIASAVRRGMPECPDQSGACGAARAAR